MLIKWKTKTKNTTRSLVFCVVFCRSLFVPLSFFLLSVLLRFTDCDYLFGIFRLILSFFFWTLCCLSFFDLPILICYLQTLLTKTNIHIVERGKIDPPNTHIHDLWPLTHKYMTTLFPGLVHVYRHFNKQIIMLNLLFFQYTSQRIQSNYN